MGRRYLNVLLSLLTFSPIFFCTTYAYPPPRSYPVPAVLPSNGYQDLTKHDDGLIDLPLTKRVKRATAEPLVMAPVEGLAWTWQGFVAEPMESGWTRGTIQQYAQQGWQQIQNQAAHATLVAALWVPRRGVYLGSIPHAAPGAKDDDEHVEIAFESIASNMAPLMWHHIQGRALAPSGSKYHAEHMALLTYERKERPKNNYPAGCYIAVFGQYTASDPNIALKRPCSTGGLNPTCAVLLRALTIAS